MVGVAAAALWPGESALRLTRYRPAPVESELASPPAASAAPDLPARPGPRAGDDDSTVYRVGFCDLVRNPERYDGKLVRTEAFYIQGIDTAALSGSACEEWARPSCAAADEACVKIWDRVLKVYRSGRSSRVRVDIVGRYTADVADPNPLQGGYHVHLLEIMELKAAGPAPRR